MANAQAVYEIRAIDRTSATLRQVQGSLRGLSTQFAALGAAAAGGAFGRFVIEAAGATDKVAKLGDRLGTSAQAIAELQFAAQQTGVDVNTMALGLQRLQRRASEAAKGTGEARDALRELGLDAAKLTKLTIDQQFRAVAQAFESVVEPATRTRLAMKLFDSEGVALLQTLKGGVAGVDALAAEFRALGGSLDQGVTDESTRLTDEIGRMTTAFQSASREMVRVFGPAVRGLAESLRDLFNLAPQVSQFVLALRTGLVGLVADLADELEFTDLRDNLRGLEDAYREEFFQLSDTIRQTGDAVNQSAPTLDVFDESLKALGTSADEAKRKQKALNDELRRTKEVGGFLEQIESLLPELRKARDLVAGGPGKRQAEFDQIRSQAATFGPGVAEALFSRQDTGLAQTADQLRRVLGEFARESSIGSLRDATPDERARFVERRLERQVAGQSQERLSSVETTIRGTLDALLKGGRTPDEASLKAIEKSTSEQVEQLRALINALENGVTARAS